MGAFYDHDCVLYMNEENELLKKIDAKMMESLLSDNPEELEEYKSLKRKQKNSAIVVMYYLRKMDLIRPN